MKLRWGLLGCGDIANKRVADAIRNDEHSELVGACRRTESLLEEFGNQYAIPYRTTSADEFLTYADLDAIYIATPVHQHCAQTIAAARSGKHVLVEKPMAMDLAECDAMIAACATANVRLGVAYYRRFYPVVARISELLAEGKLGRPLSVLATTGNPTRFDKDDWRVVKSYGGGGPLMDIGSHRLDLFLHFIGDVERVQASCSTSPDFEAEDVATVLIDFANGCHGTLQCYFGTFDVPDRLEVIGTEGRATTEDLNAGELTVVTEEGSATEFYPPHANLHAPLIQDFSAAVRSGRCPLVTGEIGRMTNAVIAMAYQ